MRTAWTKPSDTFSSWALTAVFIVIVMGLMGWFFDDSRNTLAVIGTACIVGAALGTAARARKRRSGDPERPDIPR